MDDPPQEEVIVIEDDTSSEGTRDSISGTVDLCVDGARIRLDGKPMVQPRPRFHRGGIWNKRKDEMKAAKAIIKQQLTDLGVANRFPTDKLVSVTIDIWVPRPLKHFVNGKRERGLKSTLPTWNTSRAGDVDNYAKLYMDVMTGVMYLDDSQVSHLQVYRVPDDVGEGHVQLTVKYCGDACEMFDRAP